MGGCVCKLSLRAWWEFDGISPQEISDEFNLVARNKWAKGNERVSPKGTVLVGRREGSYWSSSLADCEIERLSSVFGESVKFLSNHENFIKNFVQKGGRLNLFVGFFGDGTFGECLEAKTLADLGALRVDFGFEFYGLIQGDAGQCLKIES